MLIRYFLDKIYVTHYTMNSTRLLRKQLYGLPLMSAWVDWGINTVVAFVLVYMIYKICIKKTGFNYYITNYTQNIFNKFCYFSAFFINVTAQLILYVNFDHKVELR